MEQARISSLPGAQSKQSVTQKACGILFSVYLLGCLVSFPYHSWRYAQENGFLSWLFLGEFVPAAKSLIWPYYLLPQRNPAASAQRAVGSVRRIRELSNDAADHVVDNQWPEAAKLARGVASLIDKTKTSDLKTLNPELPTKLNAVKVDFLDWAISLERGDDVAMQSAARRIYAYQKWENSNVLRKAWVQLGRAGKSINAAEPSNARGDDGIQA